MRKLAIFVLLILQTSLLSCKSSRPMRPDISSRSGAGPEFVETSDDQPAEDSQGMEALPEMIKDIPVLIDPMPSEPLPREPTPPIVSDPDPEPVPMPEPDTEALTSVQLMRYPIDEGKNLVYASNRDMSKAAQTIETVIIVVHGIDRNPKVYFNSMMEAVKVQGVQGKTWVIAPFFMQDDDAPSASDLKWTGGNWKEGFPAVGHKGGQWSSYAVLDKLIKALDNPLRFSRLRSILMVGFSAGGQYMQRYLVGTKIPEDLPTMAVRFVVGAPGSYMYLTPERKGAIKKGVFGVPTACPDYNVFRYGLENRPDYLKQSSASDMIARLVHRDVRLIAGMADTSRGGVLDVSCAADLQGSHRYQRTLNYFDYARFLAADSRIKVFSVPNAAHEHEKIFRSQEGRAAIFGD